MCDKEQRLYEDLSQGREGWEVATDLLENKQYSPSDSTELQEEE